MPIRPSSALALFILAGLAVAQNQQVTLGTAKDNTLYFDAGGGLSNGAGTRMFSGAAGLNTNGAARRGLLAFNVAGRIPRRSTIVSATLTLSVAITKTGAQPVTLHRVLADWGEGTSTAMNGEGGGGPATAGDATWIHRFYPSTMWTSAGGDFNATPSGTASVGSSGPFTWASTAQTVADVQSWLDNPSGNFGWLLLTDESMPSTAKAFETKESPTAANRPQLVIVYTPPAAALIPIGTGCNGGGPSPLVIGGSGLPKVPNPSFGITFSGGPGSGPSAILLAANMSPVPIPFMGCTIYVNPATLVVSITAAPPTSPLPVPNNPALVGIDLAVQGAMVNTVTATLALSNGLTLALGL